jgi:apolipoprotein D and lipocalin family protein
MRARVWVTAAIAGLLLAPPAQAQGPAAAAGQPLAVVANVDFQRFTGTWHEIARFPNRYQRNCAVAVTEYDMRADGQLDVAGRCSNWSERRSALSGVARVDGPAELSIGAFSWLPLLRRTVYVLHLDERRGIAVVGEPRRKYGWIIARDAQLDARAFGDAEAVLARNGYDISTLERVDGR